jgi:uncharacterized membrane protein
MAARRQGIDAARGVAVVAMVAYHFTWDLAAFGFIDPSFAAAPGFRRAGAAIASAFLALSGVALVLAREAAKDDAAFRAKFLKRLAIIVAAAALVSLGTWFAMGERFVRFGILHCIAASSVAALPFVRLPPAAAALAGAAMLAAPWLVALPAAAHPALLWLGLSPSVPAMVDFVPVLPFSGMALLGVAAGRRMALAPPSGGQPDGASGRLARLGRVSLPVYLIHQPLLYGGLFLLASIMTTATRPGGGAVDRDTAGFRAECPRACEAQGNDKAHCGRYCSCAETEMKSSGIWAKVMASPDAKVIQPELAPLLEACFRKAQDGR